MIRNSFYILVKERPWHITIFLPITRYHVREIMDALYSIGINKENYIIALQNLTSGKVNNGITYTNSFQRETISVWGKATSPAEYFNLIVHELHHLSVQIASSEGFDLEGEEVCYINGDIAQYLYKLCKPLII